MNRQQRRTAQSHLQEVIKRHRRALALRPNDAQAHNELACVLLQQGRSNEAAALFARALRLMPELLEQYPSVVATLLNVNPALRSAVARVAMAWPRELPDIEVLPAAEAAAVFGDPLLGCMLELATVRDLNLERYLTAVRRTVLDAAARFSAGQAVQPKMLEFCCALAKQCFLNEYVFAETPQEREKATRLAERVTAMVGSQQPIAPTMLAAVGAYLPLFELACSPSLAHRAWPAPVQSLLAQQILAPGEEQQLAAQIPRLTPIHNDVSLSVRQQYEANPYPRWASVPANDGPMDLNQYLHRQFPAASFGEVANAQHLDILVAGCGTGQHSIMAARRFASARVLAVDLSISSLCYAKRMSRLFGVANVEYAQADVLELASLGRTFDLIEVSGVLHHLADPFAGWRVLVSLLRRGGLMHVGLYSRTARAQIRAARAFLAEKGVAASTAAIRRWRQELLGTPLRSLADYADYFSISECRDLLFHVQEHQLTLPEIKAFLCAQKLQFIGFELPPLIIANYRARFPGDRPMTDLASWHVFETENPSTFASMYQFWVQKT
jgi:2-polyprenyl-3-methyl-5-hydroxy-6-metoxy-1,4-benzoquinol methylase